MSVYCWNWTYMATCTRCSTGRTATDLRRRGRERSQNNKPLPWWQWGAKAASVNSSVFKYLIFVSDTFLKQSYLSIFLSIASTFIKNTMHSTRLYLRYSSRKNISLCDILKPFNFIVKHVQVESQLCSHVTETIVCKKKTTKTKHLLLWLSQNEWISNLFSGELPLSKSSAQGQLRRSWNSVSRLFISQYTHTQPVRVTEVIHQCAWPRELPVCVWMHRRDGSLSSSLLAQCNSKFIAQTVKQWASYIFSFYIPGGKSISRLRVRTEVDSRYTSAKIDKLNTPTMLTNAVFICCLEACMTHRQHV